MISEVSFYFKRFLRRLPWFLLVTTLISAVAVTVAVTLPPAYVSAGRLLVESQQIPDELASSTVDTPARELLQIIEQRLMTRENLLEIASEYRPVRGMEGMSPDEIVQAMLAHTRISSQAGQNQASLMYISFEAPEAQPSTDVVNAYISRVLALDEAFRSERAGTTLEFFELQVEQLGEELDRKSAQILELKNANADALPETLDFRLDERSELREDIADIEGDLTALLSQREQILVIFELTGQLADSDRQTISPREIRVAELQADLDEALTIYAENSPQVRQAEALLARAEASLAAERRAGTETVVNTETSETPSSLENSLALIDPELSLELSEVDSRIEVLRARQAVLEAEVAALTDSIERTPTNAIMIDELTRDYENIQLQYNTAVDRLAQASTGERIEMLSRGQRITVVEPPSVPSVPTKPSRKKIAAAGIAFGMLCGAALVALIEFAKSAPRRPEDLVSRFGAMPIATIPYIRTRRQLVLDRSLKLAVILAILAGVPAAIYALHVHYLPLDQIADRVMNRVGFRL